MSINGCAINSNYYTNSTIPGSQVRTLTMAPGITATDTTMSIVYLSEDHLNKGIFIFKPISLKNFDSCLENGKIKESKRLAVIQTHHDQTHKEKDKFIILFHQSHPAPKAAFDLEIVGQKNTPRLERINEVKKLDDIDYDVIDAIYTAYLTETLASLNNEFPDDNGTTEEPAVPAKKPVAKAAPAPASKPTSFFSNIFGKKK